MAADLASEFSSRWRKSHRQEQRVFLQCPDEKQFGLLLGGHPQMEGRENMAEKYGMKMNEDG
jgi:hypothetical protein